MFGRNGIEGVLIAPSLYFLVNEQMIVDFTIAQQQFVELLSTRHPQDFEVTSEVVFELKVDLLAPGVLGSFLEGLD